LTQPRNQDESTGAAGKPATGRKPLGRRLTFQLAALGLILASGLCGTGLAWLLRPAGAIDSKDAATGPLAPYFHGWDKPELVLVLTADQHGYLSPCGCSEPQKGGLERRYNLIQMLKARGWPVIALDLGNVPQIEAPAGLPNRQGLIKLRYAMRGMKEMGYLAVGLGDYEAAMPLARALDEYALQDPKPRVVTADLLDRDKYPDETAQWQAADPIPGVNLKVGVTAALGPSVYDKIKKSNPSVKFGESGPALGSLLKEMDAAKIDLPILLYMGSVVTPPDGGTAEAAAAAKSFPQFPLILAEDGSDLARSDPLWVADPKTGGKTMLVTLGHKGKAVGVVGVFRTEHADRPFELRYQLVEMSPDFATPESDKPEHRMIKLEEEYAKELKDQHYLEQYPQVKHSNQAGKDPMPKYVGTERCGDCHKAEWEVWHGSKHSHAYQTLVDAKWPSNRQYDPECVVCHTVGFGYVSGYKAEKERINLKNVGCESCHGPGSLHAADPNNPALLAEMNPWKAPPNEQPSDKVKRLQRIDDACQKCHDPENDVNWTNGGFERNWPKVEHKMPASERLATPGPDDK
jgi:hypothetical protein